ncbi:MAG: NADH-quinone oxidoreductase subunit NuoG, partial [Thermoanaerobaculia bacterium]
MAVNGATKGGANGPATPERATIRVDGREYRVRADENLLHACLSQGLDLPYFCWHPALGSVGACRQCAVKQFKDESDQQGRLVMACMTPVSDDARISIRDPEAADFRARVIEWLMVNHPHDCPVCDEGGECHLQDMTVMTGHTYRRFRFDKRTHRNQDLGPFIRHEMNRCIACYRCTRYYRDYAGGRDLDVFGAHDHVYFGRHEDGPLESELSGNLVEVCPTGVFTDKTLAQHYTRKWDLQSAPSVCVHCAVGCNTNAGERYGTLRRILNRYHHDVNGYFLCDRGRFGYGFVNAPERIREPRLRGGDGGLEPAGGEEVQRRLAEVLGSRDRVWGVGSPRASLEANFALRRLVGEERFSTGMGRREHGLVAEALDLLRETPAHRPSLAEVRRADAVLVLGEDPSDTAPVLALAIRRATRSAAVELAGELGVPAWHDAAVREAAQDVRSPLFTVTPAATRLDDAATETLRTGPEEAARLAWAVARELDPEAPDVPDSDRRAASERRRLARRIAGALQGARRPVVVAGTGAGSRALLEGAAAVARALSVTREPAGSAGRAGGPEEPGAEPDGGTRQPAGPGLVFVFPEANTTGVGLLGGAPLEEAFEAVADGRADTLVVLENDLFRRAPAGRVEEALAHLLHLVVLDHLETATTRRAEVVLPAATFAEGDGTLVSAEGRAQRHVQVYVPSRDGTPWIQESWRWIAAMADAANGSAAGGGELPWRHLDEVIAAVGESLPAFAGLPRAAPGAGFRQAGLPVPREPHRYSGRTALSAHRSVHEPKPPDDPDAPLAYSMEGSRRQPPPALVPYFWAPGWNS